MGGRFAGRLANMYRRVYYSAMPAANTSDPAPRRSRIRDALDVVVELAGSQDGFFTASQVAGSGVDRRQLQRLIGQGLLDRESRGLFRLRTSNEGDRAELWRAVLWPAVQRADNPNAVLSDGTALSLYEITTINPSVIDVTVPKATRLRRDVPTAVRIHQRDYGAEDMTRVHGLPATTLFRTLVDLIEAGRSLQFVDEALENVLTHAKLTTKDATALQSFRALDPRIGSILKNGR
jgi:predicted transcriptional regulator of viral defense system